MTKIIIELSDSMTEDIINRERMQMSSFADPSDLQDAQLLKYFTFGALVDRFGKVGMLIDKIDFQYELAGDKIQVTELKSSGETPT